MADSYPAKVLLFGEHTVLRGGAGLAVPYHRFRLRWTRGTPDERLLSFADYLRTCVPAPFLHTDRLSFDLRQGLRLSGNIPTGYGLGSSGAVCAAVFDRYGSATAKLLPVDDLRELLATMEGYFHGQSSGTDPLVCYLRRPIKLGGGDAGAVKLGKGWAEGLFLVDTGIERQASPLIQHFLLAYREAAPLIETGWTRPADTAIQALETGDRHLLWESVVRISDFQLESFANFIPDAYRSVWNGGQSYRLKLCGAGGGGMLLGLARDRTGVEETFGGRCAWLD